jgi:hypothetical protein
MAELPGNEGLVVKNTFLELAEPPAAPIPGQLERSHTAPPRFAPVAVTSIYDDPDAISGEKVEGNDDDNGEGNAEIMDLPPPAPTELQRLQTGYRVFDEPSEDCQWDGGVRAAEVSPGVMPCQMAPIVPVYVPMAVQMQPMQAVQVMPTGFPPAPPEGGGGGGGGSAGPPGGGPPMPQTLQRSTSVSTNEARIEWVVDARKLRGNDKQAVSPPFDLTCGGSTLPFRIMIYPKQVTDQKAGASFKKSRGRGSVTIKCEADLHQTTPLYFRIYAGKHGVNKQDPRGPVEHDFSVSAVGKLPQNIEEWDFSEVKDDASSTFVVGLEVLMQYQ